MSQQRHISATGERLIKGYETGGMQLPDGRVRNLPFGEPALVAYLDSAGIWTIGWGHTGPEVKQGTTISRSEAERLFRADIARFEKDVSFLIGAAPTTQGQYDALVSFAFNCGSDIDDDTKAEGLGDSTLLKKHLKGDYEGAAAQFALWNRAAGKVSNGLIRRRADEVALYRTADPYPSPLPPIVREDELHADNDARAIPDTVKPMRKSTTIASAVAMGAPAAPVAATGVKALIDSMPLTTENVTLVKDSVESTRAEADKVQSLAWMSTALGILVFLISAFLIFKRFQDRKQGVK